MQLALSNFISPWDTTGEPGANSARLRPGAGTESKRNSENATKLGNTAQRPRRRVHWFCTEVQDRKKFNVHCKPGRRRRRSRRRSCRFFLVVHVPCSGPCGYRPIVDGVNGEVPQSVKNCECNVQCVLGKEEHQMGQ